MRRRGQGLPINLMILAAIGLLILVIVFILVNRSSQGLSGGTSNDCVTKGGICTIGNCDQGYEEIDAMWSRLCPKTSGGLEQKCCRLDL